MVKVPLPKEPVLRRMTRPVLLSGRGQASCVAATLAVKEYCGDRTLIAGRVCGDYSQSSKKSTPYSRLVKTSKKSTLTSKSHFNVHFPIH